MFDSTDNGQMRGKTFKPRNEMDRTLDSLDPKLEEPREGVDSQLDSWS